MTFSDPDTQGSLQRSFVCVKANLVPGLKLGGAAHHSQELLAQFPEGGGGGNVRSIFCTRDGYIISEVKGFWRPGRYREEAALALLMADDYGSRMDNASGAMGGADLLGIGVLLNDRLREAHLERAAILERERASVEAERARLAEPEPKPSPWARRIAALNRMARSHRESIELLDTPVVEYLDRIADEVWTKGKVG